MASAVASSSSAIFPIAFGAPQDASTSSYLHMSGHSSSSKAGPSYFGGDDDDEDEEDDGGMLMDDDDEDEDLLDEDMLENGGGEGTRAQKITTAGEAIASSSTFMRGHGSYLAAPSTTEAGPANIIYSSLPGLVLRTNKLVSVRPLRSRYTPEVGDLVVGRITEVQPGGKRWKVDINARQDATLALSSINLPGGVQRKKLESDELQMRTFFKEGDLLVAEAQSVFNDGSVGLHTRSLRYGKLRNGELAHVQPVLIQRLKSHFVHLERANIDLTVGMNGYIWCSKHIVFDVDLAEQEGEGQMGAKAAAEGLAMAPRFEGKGIGGSGVGMDVDAGAGVYGDQNEDITPETRKANSQIHSILHLLSERHMAISDSSISKAYDLWIDNLSSSSSSSASMPKRAGGREEMLQAAKELESLMHGAKGNRLVELLQRVR